MVVDSPLMEPLLDPNGHAGMLDEHGAAAGDESNTVVGNGMDADGSGRTGVASARAEENDGDDVEGDEMSAAMQRRLDESSAVEGEEDEAGDENISEDLPGALRER